MEFGKGGCPDRQGNGQETAKNQEKFIHGSGRGENVKAET
jgi:hypothetical protein